MNKEVKSLEKLRTILRDGMVIMAGGFGLCGIPENAINLIKESGVKDLTIISNNCGIDEFGLGVLLQTRQIKKIIASYVGENSLFESQFLNGDIQVELTPQGTLAERIRAAGAGIAGFYTRTGVGTVVAVGKEVKQFDGIDYILEMALRADVAIIKAYKADSYGNLVYNKTARNFNPIMAMAADYTLAEVEEIVSIGELSPEAIHTPGIYVDNFYRGIFEKRIERLVINK